MLTSFQVAIGGYTNDDGELFCEQCFIDGTAGSCRPVSNYGLDEEQTYRAEGYEWDEPDHDGCEPALVCDGCGEAELREEYHDHATSEASLNG